MRFDAPDGPDLLLNTYNYLTYNYLDLTPLGRQEEGDPAQGLGAPDGRTGRAD